MPRTPLSRLALVLVVATVALVAAGCGGDDDGGSTSGGGGETSSGSGSDNSSSSSGGAYAPAGGGGEASGGGGGETIELAAVPGGALKFDRSSLTAKAGTVTIDFDNPSGATADHAVEVEGNGIEEESDTIGPGNKTSLTIDDLEPGTYEFYCPVPGHEEAGMKGTLTVE